MKQKQEEICECGLIEHIKSHLEEGEEVICKICGMKHSEACKKFTPKDSFKDFRKKWMAREKKAKNHSPCPYTGKVGYVEDEDCHCFCCGIHKGKAKNHSPHLKPRKSAQDGRSNSLSTLDKEDTPSGSGERNPTEGTQNQGSVPEKDNQNQKGCGKMIDVIQDRYGEGSVVNCGDYNIRKSTGKEVQRLCPTCQEKEK